MTIERPSKQRIRFTKENLLNQAKEQLINQYRAKQAQLVTRLKKQEVKHAALGRVLSYGLHDARRNRDKAEKAAKLPKFRQRMIEDSFFTKVRHQAR